jgi:regulator of sigma E protease
MPKLEPGPRRSWRLPELFETVPWWMFVVGFLLMLGPLVTVHELGHYLVGRWFGVKANVFSIGFGNEIAGFTDRRGTRWKLSALPLGGYVQFAGDMNPASVPDERWMALPEHERQMTFQAKPLWQRALIVAAGPVTNFLLAIAILSSLFYAYGKPDIPPVIAVVVESGGAAQAGVQPGDRILTVNGSSIASFDELGSRIAPYPGERLVLEVEREGSPLTFDFIIPTVVERDRFGNSYKIGQIGIGSGPGRFLPVGPVEALELGVRDTGDKVKLMVAGIWQIITGRRSVTELGGPVKMAKFSGEQLSLGWLQFISFVALVSINLGFINLLPIPALDGGHLAFYAAEAVRRKPAGPRSQEWAFRTGMAFVLALMLFVTINDVASLSLFGG